METEKRVSGVCFGVVGKREHTREPGKKGNWQKKKKNHHKAVKISINSEE